MTLPDHRTLTMALSSVLRIEDPYCWQPGADATNPHSWLSLYAWLLVSHHEDADDVALKAVRQGHGAWPTGRGFGGDPISRLLLIARGIVIEGGGRRAEGGGRRAEGRSSGRSSRGRSAGA